MNNFFYGKLAFSNLKKNGKLYLPFIAAAIGIGAMYYIMLAITGDKGLDEMNGAAELKMILGLGCGVITLFSVVLLFYTNSFLMKRRKKEFGLFNILGMEKRHIGRMMFWETCMVAFISIAGGLAAGILLYKLVMLVLLRITGLEIPFGFEISVSAVIGMSGCFLGIFAVTLIYNLFQVGKTRPIELLHSANRGEAEPKTRWLMTLIGFVALGVGYGIAIVVKNPIDTLLMFFAAVLLVILGTYCLFTAGSVAVLKLMRRKKGYYYRTSHFISVSGMIYRMKQNAAGLANICILSTMVLVMIAGTLSLYAGMEDVVQTMCPRDIVVRVYGCTTEQREAADKMLDQALQEVGIEVKEEKDYMALSVAAWKKGEEIRICRSSETGIAEGTLSQLEFITLEEYHRLSGEQKELSEDEILVAVRQGEDGEENYSFNGKMFRIKEYVDAAAMEGLDNNVIYDGYIIIVKDQNILNEMYDMQKEIYGDRASTPDYCIYADVAGTRQQIQECAGKIEEQAEIYNQGRGEQETIILRVDNQVDTRENFLILGGGFLFLGLFLGFVFLMATVLIIYYKQISEGYEDKDRFEIMQKVGMSPREARGAIRSQILKVFFLPLVMACIHLAAAFPMMNRLLLLFGMQNAGLFAVCTLIVTGVFAVIYGIVYLMTARSYYQIVWGSKR
ncbi:hypothetical protein C805_03076 [Eubacterium sp. 14-2]|uniref:FtsX-like permease family protein n=1 Tax=Eubacterium sp. 14-2 TaxID=1235790 RepID=UPI000340DAE3|nr:ABC transporter permease [Eubacterium sp. 14-2]EOT23415.1 hypothetical protein C805_03076 [Eubacterium sp. 14-2]